MKQDSLLSKFNRLYAIDALSLTSQWRKLYMCTASFSNWTTLGLWANTVSAFICHAFPMLCCMPCTHTHYILYKLFSLTYCFVQHNQSSACGILLVPAVVDPCHNHGTFMLHSIAVMARAICVISSMCTLVPFS